MRRREFLTLAAGGLAGMAGCRSGTPSTAAAPLLSSRAASDAMQLLVDVQQRTFQFFWQTTDTTRGLAPDRYPTPAFASIAAIGFALTACVVGAERGWVTRAAARERVLATLRFLDSAPQGPDASGCSGHHGFFYHFLDLDSGTRYARCELSTVDTALLMAGVRCCGQYFGTADPDEQKLRRLTDELSGRVEWTWAQPRAPLISMGWTPESGFLDSDWRGYNEAMIVYLLALGSPTFPIAPNAWAAWTSTYDRSWGRLEGIEHLTFGPLFGHQYSHTWIDFRGMPDAYMAARGSDYFINSQRAVRAQRAYAIRNPLGWRGYGANVWGLTACDGPIDAQLTWQGQSRIFHTYAARGVSLDGENHDDGTLAPTAMLASVAFEPELVLAGLTELVQRYGSAIYGSFGFLDAFNPSFLYDKVAPQMGHRVGELGWVDGDYLGIDQGPIVSMIENQRSGLIWRTMQSDPVLQRGLRRAGFTGGWLS